MAGQKRTDIPDEMLAGQFDEMKRRHPDAILLFRTGDTYMTYRQDADKASSILGIELRERPLPDNTTIRTAGFPYHALDTYSSPPCKGRSESRHLRTA